MPLYEYQCEGCGDTIEIIQKYSDPPLSQCEVCGGALERLLSPSTIQFKGSGWYVTDYASKDGKDSSSKNSSVKTGEEKATSASDSKSTSEAGKGDSEK